MKISIKKSIIIIFSFVFLFSGCSSDNITASSDEVKQSDFQMFYDKMLEKTGFNDGDITSLTYQSPKYLRYYADKVELYMGDDYKLSSSDTNNYIISAGVYYGKAENVVFDLTGRVLSVSHLDYAKTENLKPSVLSYDALCLAIKYLKLDFADIWTMQAFLNDDMWDISIAIDDSDSDCGFKWCDTINVDINNGKIIK